MAQDDLLDYTRVLYRWRRFILGFVGATAVLSILISFLLPKWYAARTTLIPPQDADISASLLSFVQNSLPGLGGIGGGGGESQLYIAILDSRTLREKLITEFDLMKAYKAKRMDDALRSFGNNASAGITDQGVIEVVVEDKDPERAAKIANRWVEHLDEFNKNARMTSAKKSRIFVENRINETKAALSASEEALAAYQQAHKDAPLTSDVASAVDASAALIARRMALQVQINMLGDLYRDSAPLLREARAELAAVDRQIDVMPPLAVEYARLIRDLKVQEQVYALLVAQFEEAKIREVKDTPTVEILDLAVPPQRKSRPIRWLFCASLTFAALVLALGTAFTVEFVRNLKNSGAFDDSGTARAGRRTD